MVQALRELTARLGVNETVEQAFSWLAEETDAIQSDKLVVLNMLPETSYFYFMKVLGDDSQVVIKIEEDNYLLKFSEQIQ